MQGPTADGHRTSVDNRRSATSSLTIADVIECRSLIVERSLAVRHDIIRSSQRQCRLQRRSLVDVPRLQLAKIDNQGFPLHIRQRTRLLLHPVLLAEILAEVKRIGEDACEGTGIGLGRGGDGAGGDVGGRQEGGGGKEGNKAHVGGGELARLPDSIGCGCDAMQIKWGRCCDSMAGDGYLHGNDLFKPSLYILHCHAGGVLFGHTAPPLPSNPHAFDPYTPKTSSASFSSADSGAPLGCLTISRDTRESMSRADLEREGGGIASCLEGHDFLA